MLRYPGGKHKTAKDILSYMPDDTREFRDLFTGSGAFILHLPTNVRIWLNDLNDWVANFWLWLRDDRYALTALRERVELCNSLIDPYSDYAARLFFNDCKDRLRKNYDPIDYLTVTRWACNAIVSRNRKDLASFSSLFQRDGMQHVNIEKAAAIKQRLQGAEITNLDYREVLSATGRKVWCFVDPPYMIESHDSPIYERDFTAADHQALAAELRKTRKQWFLTIGDNRDVERLYQGYPRIRRAYKGSMTTRTRERRLLPKTELWIMCS